LADKMKEGILYALFYLIAIGLLLYNTFGVLTIPGLIMAILAIVLVFCKKHYLVAMIGIFTAAGSFTAQYMTYFCPYCTAAAFCFLIGGLINLRGRYQQRISISILSTVCITAALTLFIFSPAPYYSTETQANEIISDKPLVYISIECRACEEVIKFLIEYDSAGIDWQPVLLGDFEKGKQYLIDKGYTGEVLSAMQPPGTVIPALVSRGEIYEGSKTIEEYFKEENHGDY
jgi:hypothetical protein